MERLRLEHFARVAGWGGQIVEAPDERVPGGDGLPYHGQDWLLDKTRIRPGTGLCRGFHYDRWIRGTIEWQRENPPPAHLKPFDYAAEHRVLLRV